MMVLKMTGLVLFVLAMGFPAVAAEPEDRVGQVETELAKQTQNPVADLISIPLQNNLSGGIGPNNRTQNLLNVQPVIPFNLNSEWNLITRTILPIIKQPNVSTTSENTWGLGSAWVSAFLSPAKPGPVMWGVGPILQFPTTTDDALGSRKWGSGPSAVALTMQGPWVLGAVAQQIWSFAGRSDRPDESKFLAQYFINYNLPNGWFLTSAPIITADWQAANGNKWTVPFGGGFGKVFFIGKLPFNANVQLFQNVVRPDPGAEWTFRFQIALLLPKSIFQ